jgi:hypothetical protein
VCSIHRTLLPAIFLKNICLCASATERPCDTPFYPWGHSPNWFLKPPKLVLGMHLLSNWLAILWTFSIFTILYFHSLNVDLVWAWHVPETVQEAGNEHKDEQSTVLSSCHTWPLHMALYVPVMPSLLPCLKNVQLNIPLKSLVHQPLLTLLGTAFL